jgi:ABC-type bacteriocin/lantibiotic exporter with double-glycine peptidase domain
MTISLIISGLIVALTYGWLMALVVLGSLPFIVIGGVVFAKATSFKEQKQ